MGRRPWLTPEQREASRIRKNQKSSKRSLASRAAKRAAKAIAEGREPGKVGQPRVLTDEQRAANRKISYQKWLDKNREARRKRDAEIHRQRRADKALAEGREPGRVGRVGFLTEQERREYARKNSKEYWDRNPERRKANAAKYYAANKEEHEVRVRTRRARKFGNGGVHSAKDIRALWIKQAGICAFCAEPLGEKKPHVDHWIPIAKGGSNGPENLRLLHGFCNRRKGAKLPSEFGFPDS